jgi:plasmid stabilization system protein ParE
MGRPRPELRPDLRSFAFRGYIILFRYAGDTMEIVNIIEGHRDIDDFFSSGR